MLSGREKRENILDQLFLYHMKCWGWSGYISLCKHLAAINKSIANFEIPSVRGVENKQKFQLNFNPFLDNVSILYSFISGGIKWEHWPKRVKHLLKQL